MINTAAPKDFFKNGLPKETCALDVLRFDSRSIAFIDANNIALLNDVFDKKLFLKQNFRKIFTPVIGRKKFIKNLLLAPFPFFTGFYNHHIASSFLRKSFETAWKLFPEQLDATCCCRVRERTNVNQWLIKDLQFVKGWFENRGPAFGTCIRISQDTRELCHKSIVEQKQKMLCLNDNELLTDFEGLKQCAQDAFSKILPERSGYELFDRF